MKTASPEAAVSFSFEVAQALLPVALWRCNELALAFQEQKTEPVATRAPLAVPSGRPKVKPAVAERWEALADRPFDRASPGAWEEWALKKGFKWASVQSCLRELEKQRKDQERAERLKNPLNAGVDSAVKNFSDMHDNDIQKDASAELPSGVFHTK